MERGAVGEGEDSDGVLGGGGFPGEEAVEVALGAGAAGGFAGGEEEGSGGCQEEEGI